MCGPGLRADHPSKYSAVAIIHDALSPQNIRLLSRNTTDSSTAHEIVTCKLEEAQCCSQLMMDFVLQIQ